MTHHSPILLFCYKRLDILKRCVASLQECPESKFSDLIIISDWGAKETDFPKVLAVRQFLPFITGFKSIEIIERTENLGVDFNIIEGIKEMSVRFSQFIVVEDDLKVAPDFLRFLNSSLNFYVNNTEILTVTAFSFINAIPDNYEFDAYFAKRTCPWGWATWANKISEVDWIIEDKELFLKSRKIQRHFNEWGSDRSSMLSKTLKGEIRAWDIRLDYHQFKAGSCTLYPIHTLVDNIGFGGSDASNTFGYNRFKTKVNFSLIENLRLPESIVFNKSISRKFILKNSIMQRIHTRVMKMMGYKN